MQTQKNWYRQIYELYIVIIFILIYMDCIYISAVKRLIVINRIQNKVLVYIIYVYVYCVYVYINTHIQYIFWKYIHILIFYIYIYIYIYMCVCVCVYMYIYIYIHIHIHTHTHTHTHIYTYTYVYIYMYMCVYSIIFYIRSFQVEKRTLVRHSDVQWWRREWKRRRRSGLW